MLAVIWKELKDRRFSLLAFCSIAVVFIWLYTALFPSLSSQAANVNQFLKSLPKGFMDSFGIDSNYLSSFEHYLSAEFYTLTWPLIALILVLSRAGSMFSGEVEQGTMGTLLSLPISRLNLFLGKYYAGLISLAVFIAASVLGAMPLAAAYGISFTAQNFWSMALISLLFGWSIYSFTVMLSCFFNDKSKVYFVAGGLILAMYVANLVSALKPSLNKLKYASVFHYFNGPAVLGRNYLNQTDMLVFAGVIIATTVVGMIWFNHRDVAV